MALFNGMDRDLPLLTQFYQLSVDPQKLRGGELDIWLRRVYLKERGIPASDTWDWEKHENITEVTFGPMADLQALIRRVMDNAFDRGAIFATDQQALAEIYQHSHGVSWCITDGQELRDTFTDPHELIPLQHIVFVPPVPKQRFSAYERILVTELIGALNWLNFGLRRCEECKSVFVSRRPQPAGQRFCSHRCADRHSQRIRRKKLVRDIDNPSKRRGILSTTEKQNPGHSSLE